MSTTASAAAASTTTAISQALDQAAGTGQKNAGISLNTFLVSLVGALITFGVQFVLFLLIKGKLSRI